MDSEPSQEAEVILARADLADGTEDQVVSKCLTCSLGMAGNPAYAAHYGPYELHLCSQTCKKHFEANPEQAILKLKLPVPGE